MEFFRNIDKNTTYPPQLIYFLSIDIVGSTNFKIKTQGHYGSSYSWSLQFVSFFEDIDDALNDAYRNFGAPEKKMQLLNKWRIIGDEIVYFALVEDLNDLIQHTQIAIDVGTAFNKHQYRHKFDIKLTSWIAGFPVNNAIIFHKNESSKRVRSNRGTQIRLYEDINFLGSSIDTGFRIAKYSTEKKYVIALDLVFIILHFIKNKYTFHN